VRKAPVVLGIALLAIGLFAGARAHAETVAVVTASPASDEAARYLTTQLEVPVVRRPSSNARHLDALVSEARSGWHEDFVVVVDAEHAVVSVVRPGDGTMSSRALAPNAAKAPYVVALAAVELLELVRTAPPARAAALSPPSRRHPVRPSVDVGLVQSVSTNGEVALLQPTAGVDLELPAWQSAGWFAVGVHGAGLVPMHRGQMLLLSSGAEERASLEYARNELALRLGGGSRHGNASVAGWSDVGLAFIDVRAADPRSQLLAEDRRTAFWLGFGGELRYCFGAGLAVGIGAGGAWFPVASRFHASPPGAKTTLVALQEGNLELRARAVFLWELP